MNQHNPINDAFRNSSILKIIKQIQWRYIFCPRRFNSSQCYRINIVALVLLVGHSTRSWYHQSTDPPPIVTWDCDKMGELAALVTWYSSRLDAGARWTGLVDVRWPADWQLWGDLQFLLEEMEGRAQPTDAQPRASFDHSLPPPTPPASARLNPDY